MFIKYFVELKNEILIQTFFFNIISNIFYNIENLIIQLYYSNINAIIFFPCCETIYFIFLS